MFQSGYEVTELREEDIIEAVPGTTVVMTSAGAVVTTSGSTTTSNVHDAVAAAVNEAIKVSFKTIMPNQLFVYLKIVYNCRTLNTLQMPLKLLRLKWQPLSRIMCGLRPNPLLHMQTCPLKH